MKWSQVRIAHPDQWLVIEALEAHSQDSLAARPWIFEFATGWASGAAMQLTLKDDLPFVSVTLAHNGRTVIIDDVLVDTGSASTLLAAHAVATVGIEPELNDILSMGSHSTEFLA